MHPFLQSYRESVEDDVLELAAYMGFFLQVICGLLLLTSSHNVLLMSLGLASWAIAIIQVLAADAARFSSKYRMPTGRSDWSGLIFPGVFCTFCLMIVPWTIGYLVHRLLLWLGACLLSAWVNLHTSLRNLLLS